MADPKSTPLEDDDFLTPQELEALQLGDNLDADGNLVAAEEEPERDLDKEDAAEAEILAKEEAERAAAKARGDEADEEDADEVPEPEKTPAETPEVKADTDPALEVDPEPDDEAIAAAEAAAEAERLATQDRIEKAVAQRARDAKRAAIEAFEEGQTTSEDFQAALDAVDDQAKWDREVWTYIAENKGLAEEGHAYTFSEAVKRVGNDEASDKLSYRQVLEKAHDLYIGAAAVAGLTPVPKAGAEPVAPKPSAPVKAEQPKPEAAKPAADAMPKKATTPRPPPPTTIARIPAAEDSLVVDGRYGQLALLAEGDDPEALEAALAKLTPDQQEEFASLDI